MAVEGVENIFGAVLESGLDAVIGFVVGVEVVDDAVRLCVAAAGFAVFVFEIQSVEDDPAAVVGTQGQAQAHFAVGFGRTAVALRVKPFDAGGKPQSWSNLAGDAGDQAPFILGLGIARLQAAGPRPTFRQYKRRPGTRR